MSETTMHKSTISRRHFKIVSVVVYELEECLRKVISCTLTYPLTTEVVGAPQKTSHFSLFSTYLMDFANSRPVHSLMLSSCLFFLSACYSSPFHCALQYGFGQT